MSMLHNHQKLVNVNTGEYPVTVRAFRNLGHGWVFGPEVDEAVANSLGFYLVSPTDRPEGDVVTEGAPSGDVASGFKQTWVVRDFTPEEKLADLESRKEAAVRLVDEAVERARAWGAPLEIDGVIQHVQLREKDIANLTGLAMKALRTPDRNFMFCSREDNVNEMTGSEITSLTDFAFEQFEQLMNKSWMLKANARSAESVADIPTDEVIRQTVYFD